MYTSLLPDSKESDERPGKEVPEERTAAQIRPTSQGARPKQRSSTATESAHKVTVGQGGSVLFNRISSLSLLNYIAPNLSKQIIFFRCLHHC